MALLQFPDRRWTIPISAVEICCSGPPISLFTTPGDRADCHQVYVAKRQNLAKAGAGPKKFPAAGNFPIATPDADYASGLRNTARAWRAIIRFSSVLMT